MAKRNRVATEDVGNVVAMEHVNVTVPDQRIAELFYIAGLGLTRDPYMMVGPGNMWVNVGDQQFHLPGRAAQVVPGRIGLVLPDIDALRERLDRVQPQLEGTSFSWSIEDGTVSVTGPWGNHFRCYPPGPDFGPMVLGIPYVEFMVKPGAADAIVRFYGQIMGAPASVKRGARGDIGLVTIGLGQQLRFVETEDPIQDYDGHHIAVYVANVSKAYSHLERKGLIMQEMGGHQYRFKDIVDPKTSERVMELEHEVRSLHHPMYRRNLVNRDPTLNIRSYSPSREALTAVG